MAAAMASKRLSKEWIQRLASLSSVSAAVHSALRPAQPSVGGTRPCHSADSVRRSFCHGGLEVRRREFFDSEYGCVGQRRRYAGSSSGEKADAIAAEMIKYAASGRDQVAFVVPPLKAGGIPYSAALHWDEAKGLRASEASHVEAIRVLEQGRSFLLNEGPSAANATGRVLLTLATLYADRASLTDAVDALQVASDLESAGIEVRVAALEALAGLCLRLQQDEQALRYADSCGQLVLAASDTVAMDELAEFKFRSKAVAALAQLMCARCGADDSKLFEDVPTWLGENSRRTAGVSAAVFSVAQCAHVEGSLKTAGELYERAIGIIQNAKEGSEATLASVAMVPDEVHIGALAGLGQLASHKGDFDEAEKKVTEALTLAEKINGDSHPRVGVILACLADVYSRRGKTKGSGDSFIISEGLYRKCQEYLGSPPVDVPETGKVLDLVDIMALSRARYAEIVSKFPNRDEEAEKLKKWASTVWNGPRPLADLMKVDGVIKPSAGNVQGHVVTDVRLGRVIWKV